MKELIFLAMLGLTILLLAGVSISVFYSSVPNNTNMVLYFQFTNSTTNITGNLVWDESGTGSNGTMVNMSNAGNLSSGWNTTGSWCMYGDCMVFDGVDDYVYVTANLPLRITDSISISFWAKPNPTGSNGKFIVIKQSTGANGDYWISMNATHARCNAAGGTYWTDSSPGSNLLDGNIWSHIAMTFSSGQVKCYLNGLPSGAVVRNSTNAPYGSSDKPVLIGGGYPWQGPPTNFFNGTIDDVRIYNRILTANDVKELYSCRNPNTGTWRVNSTNCNIQNEAISNPSQSLELMNGGTLTLTNTSLFVDSIIIAEGSKLASDGSSKWGAT